MSEYLSFNKCGQWELHKTTQATPEAAPKRPDASGKPFKVYRGAALRGELPKDNGQRGTLHDTGAGLRPKHGHTKQMNIGKPSQATPSMFDANNPGSDS